MIYELEFLQHRDTRIHKDDFLYEDSCPPIPDEGQVVFVSSQYWKVIDCFYGYYSESEVGDLPEDVVEPNVKISIHVELEDRQ